MERFRELINIAEQFAPYIQGTRLFIGHQAFGGRDDSGTEATDNPGQFGRLRVFAKAWRTDTAQFPDDWPFRYRVVFQGDANDILPPLPAFSSILYFRI